jgi:hypothetical protein
VRGQGEAESDRRSVSRGLTEEFLLTLPWGADLAGADSDDERFAYLQGLEGFLGAIKEKALGVDLAMVRGRIEALDTRRWSFLVRGYLGGLLGKHFAGGKPGRVSGILDRASVRLVRAFEIARLDHMGCVISLPICVGAFFLVRFLLNLALGKPKGTPAVAELSVFIVWMIVLGLTSSTHFSGHESRRSKFAMALVFWGSLLLLLGTAVGIRLAGHR